MDSALLSFLSGEVASACVRAIEPMRVTRWNRTDLDALLRDVPSLREGLQTAVGVDLTHKLIRKHAVELPMGRWHVSARRDRGGLAVVVVKQA